MASEGDKKPVWQILTRPRGHEHADWSIQRVEARSLLQAERVATLAADQRRRGEGGLVRRFFHRDRTHGVGLEAAAAEDRLGLEQRSRLDALDGPVRVLVPAR
ncbi:MAG: hypothetical protein AAFP26_01685, partial [Planctomycetota bacterium]